ncbi:glycosyltransferase family 2 protein [Halobacillus yeomjeoni]|uniref:glycosyltransferase family 2 protein n=1 Tax=Halobacillus yeomjeoni TaxID=311194 RepID=UPI001CD43B8E|nr:glycosyltransferase family 2 protein [Halobacillus yeomjeoni]MCA0983587.1 glycosyltransferase family 2 protein [Halobacillus yeomjeoni]
MISVVACTMRADFIEHLINNYSKQSLQDKELIIILNHSSLDKSKVREQLDEKNVSARLFEFPEKVTLGECLNFGAAQAKYEYVAKFDDDDFYGEGYLEEAAEVLSEKKCKVVGKSTFYIYFKQDGMLRLFHPNCENKWIIRKNNRSYSANDFISGASLVFAKDIMEKVKFPAVKYATDVGFQKECFKKGIPMYSTTKLHYAYIRYPGAAHHTSRARDHDLRGGTTEVKEIPDGLDFL